MDKEQYRILFLCLIGLLFFGQAVYDYIKKSHRNRTAAKTPRRSANRPAPVMVASRPPQPRSKAARPAAKKEPAPLAETETAVNQDLASAKAETEGNDQQPAATNLSDLQRAMIWSEILKRKF